MSTGTLRITEEVRVRTIIENQAKAVRAKDVEGAIAGISPDVLFYDLIDPLRSKGVEAMKSRLQDWFSSFKGALDYEVRDLNITAGDDVAFCHSVNKVKGTKNDGGEIEMWWRATVCFTKLNDEWTITHTHSSVPFDMKTIKASLDLEP